MTAPASRRPSASACSTASIAAAAGDEAGTGLGLAIVRSVAARHGADLRLGDSPLGGLRVTVLFPCRGAGSAAWGPLTLA